MEKLLKAVLLLLVVVACSSAQTEGLPDDEGFMSGDTEPGDTMIDDEDYDTDETFFEVWAHTSESCDNWFANGVHQETVLKYFHTALTEFIQRQCSCNITISNQTLNCYSLISVLRFAGNIVHSRRQQNGTIMTTLVSMWSKNPTAKGTQFVNLSTTLTVAASREAAMQIGIVNPTENLTDPFLSSAPNTGAHVCGLITAAVLTAILALL